MMMWEKMKILIDFYAYRWENIGVSCRLGNPWTDTFTGAPRTLDSVPAQAGASARSEQTIRRNAPMRDVDFLLSRLRFFLCVSRKTEGLLMKSEFSILAAIKRQLEPDQAAELGVNELVASAEFRSKQPERTFAGSFTVPPSVLFKRDLLTTGSAGSLVATDLEADSFIAYLYQATPVMALGTTVLTGLRGDVTIPRQTGTVTTSWLGEGVAATESDPAYDKLSLTPHSLRSTITISRRTLLQATPAIENLVQKDLARSLGVALQSAMLTGTGTSNEPVGLLNTTGIGTVPLGTNGGSPTWSSIIGLPQKLAEANALMGKLAFLGNGQVAGTLQVTPKVSGYPRFIQEDPATLAGYPFAQSQIVPSNGSKGTGTNLSTLIFGNWSDLILAQWGGLDILVDRYQYSTSGSVRITAFLDVDIAIRHPVSFAVISDMET